MENPSKQNIIAIKEIIFLAAPLLAWRGRDLFHLLNVGSQQCDVITVMFCF